MVMNVVRLDDRRAARPTSDQLPGLLVCTCGSTWFELCTVDDEGKVYGAVCLDEEGKVTGYSGTPHCLSCGREKLP